MNRQPKSTGNDRQHKVLVRVSVHDASGYPLDRPARVRFLRQGEAVKLERAKGAPLYEGWVEPGTYQLEASAEKLVSPPRRVVVGPEGKTASAYLGQEGWPFYRLGENAVPFAPPENLLAVAFPLRHPSPDEARKLAQRLTEQLPLEPYPLPEPRHKREDRRPEEGERKEGDFLVANGAIWLFRFTTDATPELRRRAAEAVRELVGEDARVGVPVDLEAGQVKVMDNQFVIRFRDGVRPDEMESLVKEAGGRIVRGFVQSRQARLVEFPAGDFHRHLETIEKWHEQGLLVYGEPDIMAEIVDDVFPDDAPNDPTYTNQANLTLQQVDVAWRILHDIAPNLTLGDPDVYVATLDRGVDLDHPDIGGNLTDGTAQLARCYDFSGLRACTVAGYAPDTSHGMGVYGIIAARTDNNEDIAGIAPNTHQIGMERPDLTSANYPDVLLWAAGFTTGNGSSGWPAEPISPGADIISCSHGSDGLALSGIMDDTLQDLANNGRGGLGTLVVYSAGNSNTLITGFRTWAAHPNTLALANSMQPDGTGVERKDPTSNFGPEIDVAAQGTNAPSLNDTGGEQTFGGTSAAAPTTAAIAALMLSVDPGLTWADLRDRLRATAVQIDAANTDPVGQWVGGFSQWYGFGRVNAASAVCGADPAVTLTTPNLTFNDIPEGETTVRAVVFSVESCQPVTLSIVSGPGADFSTPLGTEAELDTAGSADPREARIWIGYTGTTDGDTANGSVTIRWEETGQEWTVPISANTISRPTVALELVLDKSGSMTFNSGIPDLPQRIDVLKASVPPLLEVIHEDNALGIVSFDHDAYDVMPVTVAGPPVFGAGRAAEGMAVDAHTPNPAGNTAIGDGVERAHDQLAPETSYDVRAMVVLTDGHETAAKYIADVDHLIDERVYAIGLGTAEQIQPAALTALTNGTGGYLLLTGDLTSTDYFLLAKYYLQILAGVTNEDIVLDPQGQIGPGQTHRIPFRLNETDITADVILLTPAPHVIRFALETPDGDLITPASVAALPGTEFVVGTQASYYRLTLPVPIGAGAAAGQWHAVLTVDDKYYKRYLTQLEERDPRLYQQVVTHGVRYSLNVHAFSNLRLRATVGQDSLEPGATLTLRAVLTEYGLPVKDRAKVRAELQRPDGTQTTLTLAEVEPGVFETTTLAALSGVYRFRVLAHGHTLRGLPFTREQLLTGAVWKGGDGPLPTSADDPAEGDRRLCELLQCLLSRAVVSEKLEARLRELGINLAGIRRCLKVFCDRSERPANLAGLEVLQQPAVLSALRQLVELPD